MNFAICVRKRKNVILPLLIMMELQKQNAPDMYRMIIVCNINVPAANMKRNVLRVQSMSKDNRRAREELERIYGKGCFFKRANIAARLEEKDIKLSFKKFVEHKRYTGKKISHQISYHHLRHRSERR